MMGNYKPLSEKEEQIAAAIVDSAYTIHSAFGPGIQENIYEVCFCYELGKGNYISHRLHRLDLICEI